MSVTRYFSLESLASSHISVRRSVIPWATEGDRSWKMRLPLSRIKSSLFLHVANLYTSNLWTSQDSRGPFWISWPTWYLYFIRWVREILTFRRKVEAIFFPKAYSPLPRTHILYSSLRVVEISNPIGSHVPQRHNFPGDISPQFFCLYECSAPTSPYALSENHSWTHHSQ